MDKGGWNSKFEFHPLFAFHGNEMKRPSLRNIVLLVLFIPSLALAQQRKLDGENIFARYSVAKVFTGKAAPLDLSSSGARMYRTRLRYAIRKGPKFAGHYAVAVWGCGTGCINAAIVDLRTGKATFFPATIEEWFVGGDFQSSELAYKLHSRAWHVVGDLNEKDDPADRWFVWTGEKFELIGTFPVKRDPK